MSYKLDPREIFITTHTQNPTLYAQHLQFYLEQGLLDNIIPELKATYGFNQHNPHHQFDVFQHTQVALAQVHNAMNLLNYKGFKVNPQDIIPTLRVALLFHDIGKPATFQLKDGRGTFYGHEKESAKIARKTLTRLSILPKETVDLITLIIERHMSIYNLYNAKDATILKFVNAVTPQNVPYFLAHAFCDIAGGAQHLVKDRVVELDQFIDRLNRLLNQPKPTSPPQLAINGHDLKALGLQGQHLGKMLKHLNKGYMEDTYPTPENPF